MAERPRTSTRDFHTLHDGLEAWLGARSPGARISDLTIPESTGMSSETVVFDVHAPDGPPVPCVARMAPDQQAVPVFPSYDLPAQARAMELVGCHTDVPVPPVLWREESPEPLGSPFFVMARIDGVVPPDLPPYTFGGNWLSDAPAEH
ncbi:MAG: phosphotransferase family protein, partial [Acidimicrobiales bacterium]